MDHSASSPATPPAGIDPAAASPALSGVCAAPAPRRPRRSTADYRWTQPKVLAFLEALAKCGRVTEAARAVGMSGTSAYRLRARMASARFDAAFEGARRSGIRARAEASRARQREAAAAASRSPWNGPGIAAMVARERAFALGESPDAQGAASVPQGATPAAQGCASGAQADGPSRKVPAECAR